MRFLSSFAIPVLAFALSATAVSVPEKRQVVPDHGTTLEPTDGSTIAPGTNFPFSYQRRNACNTGYSPITVYLSTTAPASSDVTPDGHLASGSFILHWGDYLIANFGLPQMGTQPPPTLTLPTFDGTAHGTTLFLTVVETYRDCPPGGVPLRFGVETTTIVYG